MKKEYIQPCCETFAMGMENSILAGSPNKIDNGDGSPSDITKDTSTDGGWAGSKGHGGSLWDDEEDF